MIPLLKALTGAGVGSRRKLADAVRQGRVQVNGMVVEDFNYPVDLEADRITVDGKTVRLEPEQLVYLMLNKPPGVLSTTSDERGRRTMMDFLPERYRSLRLYPVGRLDKDSAGLLLMTNDGELTFRLTHPRFEHEKEYLVQIDGALQPKERRKLEQGVVLEDGVTSAARIREVKSPSFNYLITIHEGRKRQVRRMFASLGYCVLALKRVRVGRLSLGGLPEGRFRELTAEEVQALKSDRADVIRKAKTGEA